jgi:DegV family protein with EDD domain
MTNVAIVTDSTAYLPEELIQQYGIHVLPLKVIWDGESFDDGLDISPDAFYKRLAKSETMPSTSQVTVREFQELFEKLHADGKEILAVLISSDLSGTIASAFQAKSEVPAAVVEIVDSRSTIPQLGYQVLAGARVAEAGGDLAACKTAVEKARDNSGVVFAVDTLEFLHRGGRIGGAKRFLATMLNIKPILTVEDGRVDALEQARTRRKSLTRLVEIVAERVTGKSNVRLGVSHANAAEDAQQLLDMAVAEIKPVETMITELSPTIGTHVGPGAVALAYQFDD